LTLSLKDQLENPERRIADMEEMRLDLSVISIAPPHFYYNLDGEVAVAFTQRQNNRLAEIVRAYPGKFIGMATVPLQNVKAAAAEMERAVLDLNLKGVEVGSNIRGRYLGDPLFWPFYEKVAGLDVPIFIHPRDVAGSERLKDFYFGNLIGNPLDTTIAAAHIIFSGVLDRFPGLKFILSHAGGQLPYICGRFRHGFNVRPEPKAHALSEKEGVDLRLYSIIYELADDIKKAMEGLLKPKIEEKLIGYLDVKQAIRIPKIGLIAGVYVREGKVMRSSVIKLIRDHVEIFKGKIASLKRFKDDAREVNEGFECGIGLEGHDDIKAGDIIDVYTEEKTTRRL